MTIKEKIIKEIEKMSPQQLDRAYKIISELKIQREQDSNGAFSFDWEGGLRELKDRFTSVELQHHINDL